MPQTIVVTVPNNPVDVITVSAASDTVKVITIQHPGMQGTPGAGLRAGGATNSVLTKASDADQDTIWTLSTASATPGTIMRRGSDNATAVGQVALTETTPIAVNHAVRKDYVDARVGGPALKLHRTTAQDIGPGWGTISWNQEAFDTGNMWTSGTNITISKAGMYLLTAGVTYSGSAAGRIGIRFMVNDSPLYVGRVIPTSNLADIGVECHGVAPLGVGNVITVQAYQDSGGPRQIYNPDFGPTVVMMSWLQP